jgi:hypothetical protein
MADYAVVLRACPEERRPAVASLISKAFSLKDATCNTIIESTPIILIDQLDAESAAAMFIALDGIRQAGGSLELRCTEVSELPKIEWPKPPLVFKQTIASFATALQQTAPCPHCRQEVRLVDLATYHIENIGSDTDHYQPQIIEADQATGNASSRVGTRDKAPTKASAKQFTSSPMPEITPFSNPVLPAQESTSPDSSDNDDDVGTRIDELFPEDDGIIPNTNDITNILDRLLPDEQRGDANATGSSSSFQAASQVANGGYSVFLSKITDNNRRQEAVPVLADIAGISNDEAEKLSKKVIIPVLRGVSQGEAEAAKQRFAQIKVLARIKAG